jgi:hypothetical protein
MAAPEHLDALITAAVNERGRHTLGAVVRALEGNEVFYRASATATDGGQRVTTPLARLNDGSHALVVYTSKSHPDLPKTFGGAPWRHVLTMAVGMPRADWLIVCNTTGDRLPVNKAQMTAILAEQNADEGLEAAISRARDPLSDDWFEVLATNLRGRELFVRIAPEPSPDGRPVMITSAVGDVAGLVQAYTSRARPGMTYGGMTWEAIVGMVEDAPGIPGVHVINDADDWVVLERSQLSTAPPPT